MTDDEQKQRVSEANRRYYLTHKVEAQVRYMAHRDERIAYQQRRRRDPDLLAEDKETRARYYQEHREELLLKSRTRYHENPETFCAQARAWQTAHPEQKKATAAAWYQANRTSVRAKILEWQLNHPDAWRMITQASRKRRNARKRGASSVTLTHHEWNMIKAHYQYCCVYCGVKSSQLTQDHLTPLSKGGTHTLDNVVPACRSCNSKKHVGPPLNPVQPLLL